jgi:hypothetical protein
MDDADGVTAVPLSLRQYIPKTLPVKQYLAPRLFENVNVINNYDD